MDKATLEKANSLVREIKLYEQQRVAIALLSNESKHLGDFMLVNTKSGTNVQLPIGRQIRILLEALIADVNDWCEERQKELDAL